MACGEHVLAVVAEERAGHVDGLLHNPVGVRALEVLQLRQPLHGAVADLARVEKVEARRRRLTTLPLGRAHWSQKLQRLDTTGFTLQVPLDVTQESTHAHSKVHQHVRCHFFFIFNRPDDCADIALADAFVVHEAAHAVALPPPAHESSLLQLRVGKTVESTLAFSKVNQHAICLICTIRGRQPDDCADIALADAHRYVVHEDAHAVAPLPPAHESMLILRHLQSNAENEAKNLHLGQTTVGSTAGRVRWDREAAAANRDPDHRPSHPHSSQLPAPQRAASIHTASHIRAFSNTMWSTTFLAYKLVRT